MLQTLPLAGQPDCCPSWQDVADSPRKPADPPPPHCGTQRMSRAGARFVLPVRRSSLEDAEQRPVVRRVVRGSPAEERVRRPSCRVVPEQSP